MKNSPLVSVGIPTFKSRFLAEAIQSVLNQTYSNLEIIVINDQSPDDIDGVMLQFHDPRIRYYTNPKNLGAENPANNWNECLSHARGEFFALLCDDDLYEPNFVATMLELAEKYPQTNVFRSRANFINAQGKEINRYASAPEWETWDDYLWHVCQNYRSQTISEWFFRRTCMERTGGYAMLPLAWYADYLSIYRFAQEGGIASTYKKLVHFRLSGDNISSQDRKNNLKKIEAQQEFRKQMTVLLENHPDCDHLLGMIDWWLRGHLKFNLEHTPKKVLFWLYWHHKKYGVQRRMVWRAFLHKQKD